MFCSTAVSLKPKDSILSSSQLCWAPERNFVMSKVPDGGLGTELPNVRSPRSAASSSIAWLALVSRFLKKPSAIWPISVSLALTVAGS